MFSFFFSFLWRLRRFTLNQLSVISFVKTVQIKFLFPFEKASALPFFLAITRVTCIQESFSGIFSSFFVPTYMRPPMALSVTIGFQRYISPHIGLDLF